MAAVRPNFVVGIGGSAGGLSAYKALVGALPANTRMAFIVVSHMLPTASSALAEVLSARTKMRVSVATKAMPIRANHIYVSAPNSDVLIENAAFKIVSPRSGNNMLIDIFFASIAEEMGSRAIGIILSGALNDGTEGCKRIKAKGGTTFAQDESAEVSGMPRSAQAAGCIDFVLSPDEIAAKLSILARASNPKRRRRAV